MKFKASLFKTIAILTILILGSGTVAGNAYAQEDNSELAIMMEHHVDCGDGAGVVEFSVSWEPVNAEYYQIFMDFGDGETTEIFETEETSLTITHTYIDQGDYDVVVQVGEIVKFMGLETSGLSGSYSQILTMEGPEVNLISAPAPPVFVAGEDGQVTFTAETYGGTLPYSYEWDLDGGETNTISSSDTASATYTDVGKYTVKTTVTDGCGFTTTASLPVVVADPEEACHPMAQKIAEGVSSLFPDQAGQEYSCEDIYTLFDNEEGGNNIGFGRMWMAYNLAGSIDLTWEEMLAWQMDTSGWGSLLQLNRFTEVLSEQGIGDLMALVMSEDYTLADVRAAVRSVSRYAADFDDALERIAEGASAGELTQFYSLVAELGADYEIIDGFLADGMTLSELKHAANFAERMGAGWTEVADFRSLYGDSWGDLKQAYSMATDGTSAADILAIGVQEYRKDQTSEQQAEKTAERLAGQYGSDPSAVTALFNGACAGSWSCVRNTLREGAHESAVGLAEKDNKTAKQIGGKYGFDEQTVLAHYQGACEMDWACVRSYFRNLDMDTKETGKPK